MYIIIDILIFQVSMNSKGGKFQLWIKFLYDLIDWNGRLHDCVVCQFWNGKQDEEYCVEQVISFQQQTNMENVFDEVVYPEELTLKKKDHVQTTQSCSLPFQ
jgi:hypothetical protein